MTIQIRLLEAGEDHVLDDAAAGVFDDPIDASGAKTFLEDARHHISVALDEGVVVGFVSAVHYVHPDKPAPELWINEVAVAPTHRRRGIAKSLMDAILRRAREVGCSEAWVLTDASNGAAMALYAAAGGKDAPGNTVMFEYKL